MGPHNLLYPAYLTFVGMLFFPFLIEREVETKPGTKHLFSEKNAIVYLNEPFESFPLTNLTLKEEDSITLIPSIAELSGSTCGPGGITTDLYVWLRADKEAYNTGTTDATDGQTIATWNDQSITDTDASSDGNPPTFKNNSTDNINFNPTLDFDGTNDRLNFGNLANIKSGSDYTIIAVGMREIGTTNYFIGSSGSTNNQSLHLGYRGVGTTLALDHFGSNISLSVNDFDDPAETPFLVLGEYDGTNRFLEEVRNGTLTSSSAGHTTGLLGTSTNYIGHTSTNFYFNGLISEVIIYDNDITDTNKDKIYSYLAIKYGIELDNTGGGTNGDYTNAAGTTLWDASANSTYHNDIAGIGRDDDSELNQKQAKSANTDAIVSIGLGSIATTNSANSNSFSADNSFMFWGNDNAATAQASANTADLPAGVSERMSRVWKVAETGTVGNVEIQFDLTGLGYDNSLNDVRLIVSNTATMASGTLTDATSVNGNVVSFSGVDLSDGQFFSLATKGALPGGVTTDLYVWLKADKEAYNTGTTDATDGQTVATWNDQSYTDTDASSDGNPPTFKDNSTDNINFNPTLDFDGTNDRLNFGNLANIKSGSDYTIITVGMREIGTTNYFIGSSGSTNNQSLHLGYRGVGTTLALDHFGSNISLSVNDFDDPAETPFLVLGEYDGTNRFLEEVRNGTLTSSSAGHTTGLLGASTNYIGHTSTNFYFNGLISEVIIYDNDITDTDKDKIYSYLAIKYGIELDSTGGGTNGDYTNAAGTTLWDASANSTYHHDVAGIGRDDDSELNQKQSKSANTDAIVSMGLGSIATTNSANSNSFSADNSFMLWGNDNAATTQAGANTTDLPVGSVTERMSRVWKVTETGTVGNVEIQFDLTGLGYDNSLSDVGLIISNSATMASGTVTNASSVNGTVVTFTGVDLSDGQYFSLATKGGFPGGVTTDLYVWLKANKEAYNTGTTDASDGQTVATWNDQSYTDTDANSDGNPPIFKNNSTDNINFNPTLDFDGNNDRLNFGNLANIKSGSDYTIIAVGMRETGTTNYFIGSSGSTNDRGLHLGYRGVGTTLALDHFGSNISFSVNDFDDPAETPFLVLGEYDGTNRFLEEVRNGTLTSSSAGHTTGLLGTSTNYIGHTSTNFYFNGLISEVIIYDNDITDTDKNKIYSYLAIKYGIELDNTGGGTNGDYINAAGTTIWDASANSTYHNDIAGIGQDDTSELNQKQSKSANTDAIVSMGLGSITATNSVNSNSFSANNSFMLWGNDNAATTQASANTADLPSTVLERVSRVWKVEETGTVGNVEIQFDLTGLGYGTTLDDFHLIVSGTATMASGTLTPASSVNGNVVSFTGVDLSDGQFFSLATKMEAPGAVSQDLSLWLKADAGTNTTTQGAGVTSWNDLGGEAQNATGTGDAKYNTNWSNGNPSVEFTNDLDAITGTVNRSNGQGSSLFMVGDFSSSTSMPLMSFLFNSTVNHNLWNNNYSTNPPGAVNFSFQSGQPGLWGAIDPGNANDAFIYENGADKATMTNNLFTQWFSATYKLGQQGTLTLNTGHIAEVIFYDKQLSVTERHKVESYLALKYGIELDNTGGGIAGDYTNSAGTTLWDASANSSYHHDVAGIGRDDDSALSQKQSKSANSDAIVHIGLGSIAATNATNGNSFSVNNSFILWGNDNATTAQASANTADLPSTVLERISRVWKVEETGTVGNVEIQFDLTGLGYSTTLDDFQLIISGTATMASGTLTPASSVNGNVVSFTGVDLSDGQFFSLATKMEAPGAVSQDLSLWLKADAGTNTTTQGAGITSWNDLGGEAQNATGTGDAKYNTNWSNGNPAVEFTNDLEAITGMISRSNGQGSSLFMVGDFSSSTSMPLMSFEFNSTVNHNLWNNNYSTNPPGAVNFSFQSGQSGLWGAIDPGNANDAFIYENGADKATMTNNLFTQWNSATYKLGQQGTLALNTGHIAEVIFYDKQLSATERHKVESYLALKYGIELDNTGGGTAGDYTNAAGTTLWDASDNSIYHNDVTGIGRDDDSALNQKQSKSTNTDAIVHIGLGSVAATNSANSNSFSADNSFMLWGNDNAATTQASANTTDLPSTILERVSRVWKVEETGTVGNVEIQFDLNGLGYSTTLDDFHLIVSGSATMASGTLTPASSVNSNVVSFTGVDLSDGQFFSLATKMEAPGAVSQDLSLWLKADEGTNTTTQGAGVTGWNDLGGEAHNATGTGDAKYNTNWSNGNPAVEFTNDLDAVTGTVNRSNGFGSSLFVVGEFSSSTSMPLISFTFGASTNHNLWNNNYSSNPPGQVNFSLLRDQPGLWGAIDPGNANDAFVYENGGDKATMTNNLFTQWFSATYRLAQHSTFPLDNGHIAEVILYDKQLSATERNKVESYLALKYGIELDNTGGGTAGDYVSSAGTTAWDASANSTYHHNVAGIGRDDDSALNQKQSKSANSDAIVKIGLDGNSNGLESTNTDNPSTFSTDNAFLIWGHDGEALTDRDENIDFDPLQVKSRLNREWRVQETGTLGSVIVQFDISAIEGLAGVGTNDESQVVLLVDSDSDFSSGASLVLQSFVTPGDGLVNFNVDFSSGLYFTLASSEETALAVSLISFEARLLNNSIRLRWSTGSEEANSLFRIERSADGERFETIGHLEGANNSVGLQEYEFSDNDPIVGTNYYRLIDIDLAGKENASEMIRAVFNPSSEISPPYPNPVKQGIDLIIPINRQTSPQLEVYGLSGKVKHVHYVNKGAYLYVDTALLQPGVYMILVKTAESSQKHKVIVLDN